MFSSLLELSERVMAPVGGLSPMQRTFIKAATGLALTKDEIKLWRLATGRTGLSSVWRRNYTPRDWSEIWLLCGRRSFKTTFGAILTIWEATRRTPPEGQSWKIPILSPGLRQGQKGSLDVVRSTVKAIPELAELLVADSEEALTFSTGIEVLTLPPKIKLVQGWTCPLIWCDEASNFSQEDTSESNLADVLDAIRPSIATVPGARIYVSSLPGPDTGTIFEQWENRFSGDALIFKADSVAMNPSLENSEEYQKAKKRKAYFDLYYSGSFVKARSGLLPGELIDAAIRPIPPLEPYKYVAALGCDFATGGDSKSERPKAPDDCAAVIAAKTLIDGVEKIAIVWARAWSVKAGQIHPVLSYMEEIAQACARFGVREGVGDQKSLAAAVQFFGQRGITYSHLVTNGAASEPVFDFLRTELNEGLLILPNDPPILKSQLRSLEERRDGGRSYEVAATGTKKDDLATACAAATFKVASLRIPREPICTTIWEWERTGDAEEEFWAREAARQRTGSLARPRF
jgi:hypothetical protein